MDVQIEYRFWVDWEHSIVSFHLVEGFEPVSFSNHTAYQANIQILVQSGFRFQ